MYVGVALIDLLIEDAQSLKDKRMVVRSLRDKVRRTFEVSVAEVGFNAASVRAICERAGVKNIGAINYYFGGKENLYAERESPLMDEEPPSPRPRGQ